MLDKGIKSGKEHRKPYRKSARFDRTCRPGGTCEYCPANRAIQQRKAEASAESKRED